MTIDEAIKALTGEPIRETPTITTTGALPLAYTVLYEKMLAETVEIDGAALAALEEDFWEIYEPI